WLSLAGNSSRTMPWQRASTSDGLSAANSVAELLEAAGPAAITIGDWYYAPVAAVAVESAVAAAESAPTRPGKIPDVAEPNGGAGRPPDEIIAVTAIRHLLDDAQAGPVSRDARGTRALAIRTAGRQIGGICGTGKRSEET